MMCIFGDDGVGVCLGGGGHVGGDSCVTLLLWLL